MIATDLPPVYTQTGDTCTITDYRGDSDTDTTITYSTGYYTYDDYYDDAILPEDKYDIELKVTARIAHNNSHRVKEKLNNNKHGYKRHQRKSFRNCNRI